MMDSIKIWALVKGQNCYEYNSEGKQQDPLYSAYVSQNCKEALLSMKRGTRGRWETIQSLGCIRTYNAVENVLLNNFSALKNRKDTYVDNYNYYYLPTYH